MCNSTGVKLDSLQICTLRTDLIEEFFGGIKKYAKSQLKNTKSFIQRDFESYVKSCVMVAGSFQNSAKVISEKQAFPLSSLLEEGREFISQLYMYTRD